MYKHLIRGSLCGKPTITSVSSAKCLHVENPQTPIRKKSFIHASYEVFKNPKFFLAKQDGMHQQCPFKPHTISCSLMTPLPHDNLHQTFDQKFWPMTFLVYTNMNVCACTFKTSKVIAKDNWHHKNGL